MSREKSIIGREKVGGMYRLLIKASHFSVYSKLKSRGYVTKWVGNNFICLEKGIK